MHSALIVENALLEAPLKAPYKISIYLNTNANLFEEVNFFMDHTLCNWYQWRILNITLYYYV